MPKTLAERLKERAVNFGILPGRVSVVKIADLDLASIERGVILVYCVGVVNASLSFRTSCTRLQMLKIVARRFSLLMERISQVNGYQPQKVKALPQNDMGNMVWLG